MRKWKLGFLAVTLALALTACGTKEEKIAILQKYSYNSEEEARADIWEFVNNLPEDLKEEISEDYADVSEEELGNIIFDGEYSNIRSRSHFHTERLRYSAVSYTRQIRYASDERHHS